MRDLWPKWAGVGIVVLLLIVFSLQLTRSLSHIDQLRPPRPGTKAPLFDLATESNQARVKLESLKGDVVILDFFATWCMPCQQSMPQLERFASTHSDELSVVAISLDNEDDHSKALAMAKSLLPSSTFAMADGDVEAAYAVSTIPHLVIIDREGVIRRVFRGTHSTGMVDELERATRSLW